MHEKTRQRRGEGGRLGFTRANGGVSGTQHSIQPDGTFIFQLKSTTAAARDVTR